LTTNFPARKDKTMNELSKPDTTTLSVKLSFYGVCLLYNFYEHTFQTIADMAKIHVSIVVKMFVNYPVSRAHAERVLTALSIYTGAAWNLGNTQVVLMPTFKEICESHSLSIDVLTGPDTLYQPAMLQMLKGKPVLRSYAVKVLSTVSAHAGKRFTLDDIDVPLIEEVQS
jgi:hypothetical protein